MAETNIEVDPSVLIDKLREVEKSAEGDLARVIELLLLENNVLRQSRSAGIMHGTEYRFDGFPRFLTLDHISDEED